MKMQEKRSSFLMGRTALILLVLLAVLLNTGVFLLPSRIGRLDTSRDGTYTLSDQIKRFLNGMEREVTVYVLDADGSDMKLEYFLDVMDEQSDKLRIKPIKSKSNRELLQSVGINVSDETTEEQWASLQYSMIVESDRRKQAILYPDLFYYINENTTLNQAGITQMSMSEYSSYLQQFNSYAQQSSEYATYLTALVEDSHLYFQGEALLAEVIEYVSAEYIPISYVLTGHGEADISSLLVGDLLSSTGISYQTLTVSAEAGIPQDAASILVLAPTSDYSEQEIAAMKAYLARGGQMTFVTGEANLSMPNLMALMAEYGMTAETGFVGEEITVETESETETESDGENTEGNGEEAESQTKTEISYTVSATINMNHDALAAVGTTTSIVTAVTNGNAILFGDAKGLTAIYSTSDEAFIGENTAEKATRILAASAEASGKGRLVWFTGAESFLTPSETYETAYLEAQSGTGDTDAVNAMVNNAACLGMLLEWTDLLYESELMLPDATLYDTEYLTTTDSHLGVAIACTIVLPLVIGAAGVLIWYKRKHA